MFRKIVLYHYRPKDIVFNLNPPNFFAKRYKQLFSSLGIGRKTHSPLRQKLYAKLFEYFIFFIESKENRIELYVERPKSLHRTHVISMT
ncbi:hypothetical protein EG14_10880 [Porphyromonas gingivalis]|nr:hypothetical protein EG14_10880 [Porphyromonas gingivalis]